MNKEQLNEQELDQYNLIPCQEYRRCVADWKLGVVTALFDTLHAMCNLLILPPENLRGAAMGDQLASVDKTILDNWLQLRVDYKTARLANCL